MVLWPAGLILVSLICLSSLEYLRQYREASLSWPTAEGRIIDFIDLPASDGAKTPPTVTYEFKVNGKRYQGSRYHYSSRLTIDYTYDECLEYCEKYRRGSTVSVSYDPADPKRCCLVPGPVHQYEFARDYAAISLAGLAGLIAQVVVLV